MCPLTLTQASERYSAYKFVTPEEIRTLKVDEATLAVLDIESNRKNGVIDNLVPENETAIISGATIYFDGGSRGNPGPAAIGYYIVGEDGKEITRGGDFIGFATSRIAEYYAMKEGCLKARELGLKRVRFVGDNLMMINQLRGIYQVKNKDLLSIYQDIQEIIKGFEAVSFVHVKREQNREADFEANKAMEGHFSRRQDKK